MDAPDLNLGEVIGSLLKYACDVFNNMISAAQNLFVTNPVDWENGAGWKVITDIYPIFVSVASSLVVIFFLIGFCSEAMQNQRKITFEAVLGLFIRVCVAGGLVASSLDIVKGVFGTVTNLAKVVSADVSLEVSYKTAFEKYVNAFQCEDWTQLFQNIFGVLFALVGLIVFVVCGVTIVYTAYMRLFKCLVAVPYAALAFSTVAGNSSVMGHTMQGFIRYLLTVSLEVVTMIMVLTIGVGVINSKSFQGLITVSTEDFFIQFLNAIITKSLSLLVIVGLIKGSEQMTRRALSLR